jgi:hypothetical protein
VSGTHDFEALVEAFIRLQAKGEQSRSVKITEAVKVTASGLRSKLGWKHRQR